MTRRNKQRSGRKARNAVSTELVGPNPPISPDDDRLLEAWRAQTQERRERLRAPAFHHEVTPGATIVGRHPSSSLELWIAQVEAATGALDWRSQQQLMAQVSALFNTSAEGESAAVEKAVCLMAEIAPRDGIEGMLAVQMVSVQVMAMRLMSRAGRSDTSMELAEFYLRNADRLMRRFSHHLDALNRHRGRGPSEQHVKVEHVHVHPGGQAVVGIVATNETATPPRTRGLPNCECGTPLDSDKTASERA